MRKLTKYPVNRNDVVIVDAFKTIRTFK